MWWPVVILICSNIIGSFADVSKIVMEIKTDNQNKLFCGENNPVTLNINETFNVVVKHSCIFNSSCTSASNTNQVFIVNGQLWRDTTGTSYFARGILAIDKMNTQWHCLFYADNSKRNQHAPKCIKDESYIEKVNCFIDVTLLDNAEDRIIMKVNEDIVNPLSVKNVHYFYDGELLKITCAGLAKLNLPHIITYQPIYPQFEGEQNMITYTYIKMKEEYDRIYIDCDNTNLHNAGHSAVRVSFYNDNRNGAVNVCGFKVNGLKYINKLNHSSYYAYEYYDNERLTIESFIDTTYNTPVHIECVYNNNGTTIISKDLPCCKKSFKLLSETFKKEDSGLIIYCKMSQTIYANAYPNHMSWTISLGLVFDATFRYFDPYIGGLSRSKTLAKYQYDIHHNIIVYEYDDEISLICYSNHPNPLWHFNETEVRAGTENGKFSDIINKHTNSRSFQLIGEINRSIIKCVTKELNGHKDIEKSASVKLVRSGTKSKPQQTTDVSLTTDVYTDSTKKPTSTDRTNTWILVVCGLLVIIIIISASACVITIVRKRKRHNPESSDIDYQNLPHHNEGPMAMPSQWDTYAEPADLQESGPYSVPYIENNLDIQYSKPLPKNKRNKNEVDEPSYAAVGNTVGLNEPNYAAVGKHVDLDEPSYAAVGEYVDLCESSCAAVGKHVHFGELNYADIDKNCQHGKNNEYANKHEYSNTGYPPCSQVLPNTLKPGQMQMPPPQLNKQLLPKRERGYAEENTHVPGNIRGLYGNVTGESEYSYATPEQNKYANEIDGQSYANANSKGDYAEPAYCEFVKK